MKGYRIDSPSPHNFAIVFASVMSAFEPHYWLINAPSGPFSITDKSDFSELDAELNRYYVSVPELKDTSAGLWRPGVLRFADLLVIDECTAVVGILGTESKAKASAEAISSAMGLTPQFFDSIQTSADCALLHIDGWWEVYSMNSDLMQRVGQIEGASATESGVLCRLLNPK